MQREQWGEARRNWAQSGYPVTIGLMVAQFLVLILVVLRVPIANFLSCAVPQGFLQPWRLLTYSLLPEMAWDRIFFSYLFKAGMTYWFCGSLERSWGSRSFGIFYAVLSIVSALFLLPPALLFKIPVGADDMLPVAACAVAWGVLNAHEGVNIFFIPTRGIYISLVAVLVIAFDYALQSPLLVPFAIGGCAVSYYWMRHRSTEANGFYSPTPLRERKPKLRLVPPVERKQRPLDDRFTLRDLNPFEWFAKRQRRKKFERLMKDD